jgi:hypothetical protein
MSKTDLVSSHTITQPHIDRGCGRRRRRHLVVVAFFVVVVANLRLGHQSRTCVCGAPRKRPRVAVSVCALLHRRRATHGDARGPGSAPAAIPAAADCHDHPASGAVLDRGGIPPTVSLSCAPVTPSQTRLCVCLGAFCGGSSLLRQLSRRCGAGAGVAEMLTFVLALSLRKTRPDTLRKAARTHPRGAWSPFAATETLGASCRRQTAAAHSSQRPCLSVVRLAMYLPRLAITAPNHPHSLLWRRRPLLLLLLLLLSLFVAQARQARVRQASVPSGCPTSRQRQPWRRWRFRG